MKILRYTAVICTALFSLLKADVPMPVELVYFEGNAIENGAHLIWGTATELNNYGFEIQRSINQSAFENVGFVFGHGTTYAPHDYEFDDTGLVYSGTYRYFLKQIDNDGQFKHSDTISIDIISTITTTINYFQIEPITNGVSLTWGTTVEVNNYGFAIFRSINQSQFDSIGFVNGHGTSIEPWNYSYSDIGLTISGSYSYFLKQINSDGQFRFSDTISIDIISTITTTISYFQFEYIPTGISLLWGTTIEVNNYGFAIFRSINQSTFDSVGFVDGHGTSTEPWNYSYADLGLNIPGIYNYFIKQINNNGDFKNSDTLFIDFLVSIRYSDQLVNEFSLLQNYPNPFNPKTVISYQLPAFSNVVLKVYNILGNEITTLVDELKSPGIYEVEFNADKYGLSSGVYFYRLEYGNFSAIRKLILQK
jgi:creatinine amidohydrolase/Fe(II)-dependent formamide hydrolase-like protein